MNVKIKICGMRDPHNIKQVSLLSPDFIGFIFYEASPRFVGYDFVIPELAGHIKKVGVFVKENTEKIITLSKIHNLEYVQLHGGEPKSVCLALKSSGLNVIKVFSVDDDFDFSSTEPFMDAADYFLFDAKGSFYGGNARAFNWSKLTEYKQQVPFILSGGISITNVDDIKNLQSMNLFGIDLNSGVETSPATKDIDKIKEIKKQLAAL